jgi:hypothetical protein
LRPGHQPAPKKLAVIACPNPDCTSPELADFEVETLCGLTGPRMYVDCPDGHRFEVEVFVQAPAAHRPDEH